GDSADGDRLLDQGHAAVAQQPREQDREVRQEEQQIPRAGRSPEPFRHQPLTQAIVEPPLARIELDRDARVAHHSSPPSRASSRPPPSARKARSASPSLPTPSRLGPGGGKG